MRIRTATLEDESRWDHFVATFPEAQFSHAAAFRDIAESVFGLQTEFLMVESSGELSAICPLVYLRSLLHRNRLFLISLPFVTSAGPLCREPAAKRALLEHLQGLSRQKDALVQLRSHPAESFEGLATSDGYLTLKLELSDFPEEDGALLKRLSARNRTKVRKARKHDLRVSFGRKDLLPAFYDLYFLRQRHFATPAYPLGLFERLLKSYPKAEVALVCQDRQPVAGMFNIGFGKTLHYVYGGSDSNFFSLYPNNLLFFEVIQRAVRSGYSTLDFGRSEPGSGTHRFKKQWGATETPLSYQYLGRGSQELTRMSISGVRSSLPFRVFHFLWSRCLPDWVLRWLGIHLIKRMPLA